MIDYRQRPPERARPTGPSHRQIALLVFALGLVVVLMDHARRPANWYWLWGGKPPEAAATAPQEPAVDTRMAAVHPPVATADAFRSPPPSQGPETPFPGIRPGYFTSVEDDTVFRGAEDDAWFHLFEVLRETPQSELAAAAAPVDFAQLFQQPGAYRGRLVRLEGRVRQVERHAAPANSYGVKDYYRAVLETAANPVFVYFLELPPGFPAGNRIYEDVGVSGFFFKRLAYRAIDDIRTAPVIAARTLAWSPRTAATQRAATSSPWLPWLVLAGVSYAGWLVWRLWPARGSSTSLWQRRARDPLPLDPSFETVDPREALADLAREHDHEQP